MTVGYLGISTLKALAFPMLRRGLLSHNKSLVIDVLGIRLDRLLRWLDTGHLIQSANS